MDILIFAILTITFRDSSNVRLIGWWPYGNSNTVISNGNYTYLGSGFGIYILRTDNPNSPQLINQVPTKGEVNRLFINGNYLYVANGFNGLKIFDITNPEYPITVGELELNADAEDVFVKDSFVYVGTSGSVNGLWIINISDPHSPILRGVYSYSGYWGCYGVEVNDTFAYITAGTLKIINIANPATPQLIDTIPVVGFFAVDVEIHDTILYFTEHGSTNYLRLANIADPTNPIICYNSAYPQAITHIDVKDSFCFIAHATTFYIINTADPYHPYTVGVINNCGGSDISIYGEYAFLTGSKLRIINVDVPQNPYIVSLFYLPGSIYNISVCDSIACLAMGWNGLWIMDISNSTNPFELGKWIFVTKDVFTKNSLAYCVGDSGLSIVDIRNPEAPVLVSNLLLPYQAWTVTIVDALCYIADGYGGLRIVNVSDSTNPFEIGFYPSGSHTWDADIEENIAYIADHSDGLKIVDVSNPSSPILLSHILYNGYLTKIVKVKRDTLFCVTNTTTLGYLRIVDASNPLLPIELGTFYSPYPIDALAVSNHFAYILSNQKLSVINCSNPANPAETGYYQLPANGYSLFSYGSCILAGTFNAGLMVFEYFGTGINEADVNIKGTYTLPVKNPVRNEVLIEYCTENDYHTKVQVFDIQGRLCFATDVNFSAGRNIVKLNLTRLPAGIYFIYIKIKEERCMGKFLLLK